jgi:centromeric protein E
MVSPSSSSIPPSSPLLGGQQLQVSGTAADPGIVPIAVNELFHFCRERAGRDTFQVTLGYMEIYNERIFDLCSDGNVSQELPLYEDPALGTRVRGLTESLVTSPEKVLHSLALAQSSRKMAATAMNLNSSRSHTITRLVVECTSLSDGSCKQSMLSLVDLAGSERASKTKAKGDTLREGAFINKSLLTLSSVIAELSKEKPGHVPFRDSKLTR